MKIRKVSFVFGILLIALLSFSFASACAKNYHSNQYDDSNNYYDNRNSMDTSDGVIFIVYDNQYHGNEIYEKENSDRYPISTYEYGYSYRAEQEYYFTENMLNSQYYYYSNNYRNSQYDETGPNWLFNDKSDHVIYQDKPNYYYLYNQYVDAYEQHECYVNPPSDKLIYVKCP